jgi:hypothetical protein
MNTKQVNPPLFFDKDDKIRLLTTIIGKRPSLQCFAISSFMLAARDWTLMNNLRHAPIELKTQAKLLEKLYLLGITGFSFCPMLDGLFFAK